MRQNYSTKKITPQLLDEIKDAIRTVSEFGSIEIYVQGGFVTQITTRKIKKTSGSTKFNGENKTNNVAKRD